MYICTILYIDLYHHRSLYIYVHRFEIQRFISPGDGVHIRFKCSEPLNRPSKTKELESCTNWEYMNSLGVKTLDYGVTLYKDFYDDYEPDGVSVSFFGRFSKITACY